MQRGSALIILLALLTFGIVGGYFLFTNKSSDLSKLVSPKVAEKQQQTYTNSNLGFEFQYEGYTVKEDSEEEFNERGNGDFRKNFKGYVGYEPGIFAGGVVVLGEDNSYDQNPLTLWVFRNQDNLTIDKWFGKYWYYPFVWGDFTSMGKITLAPKDEATVSGQMGKSGMIDYQPGKPKFVYVSNSGKMYLFRVIGQEGDKILATFKFSQ